MPFKSQLIKNMQKNVANYSKNTSSDDQAQNSCKIQYSEGDEYLTPKVSKKVAQRVTNVYQNMLLSIPLKQRHIFNFFNLITLNQEALRSEDCQQSYFRSLFYTKTLKKVVYKPRYMVLSLVDSDINYPPVDYIVSRFKSFGDQKFFRFAQLIERTALKLKQLQKHPRKKQVNDSDLAEKYVESMGNRMFYCKSNNKVFLSKSLLEVLEYDPENLAIEMIKYRASLYDPCTTEWYVEVLSKTFDNLYNLICLLLDQISLETFLDNSLLRLRDTLYTKNGKKITAKFKVGMATPLVTICEVEEIISITDQFEVTPYFKGMKRQQLSRIRQDRQKAENASLRFISDISRQQPEKKLKIASYVQIQESQQIKNEE